MDYLDPNPPYPDPSMTGSNFPRNEADFYRTPAWCTEVLLQHFKPTMRTIWEPACGDGAISKVLLKHKLLVMSSDLVDRGYGEPKIDFLHAMDNPTYYERTSLAVITNPPYKLAEEFVRKATENFPVTVMLLRNEWDCAKKRTDLFTEGPGFYKKIVLTSRPRWIEGTTGAPRHNYAWYIWVKGYEGEPVIVYGKKPKASDPISITNPGRKE